jgi:hypothetical protein
MAIVRLCIFTRRLTLARETATCTRHVHTFTVFTRQHTYLHDTYAPLHGSRISLYTHDNHTPGQRARQGHDGLGCRVLVVPAAQRAAADNQSRATRGDRCPQKWATGQGRAHGQRWVLGRLGPWTSQTPTCVGTSNRLERVRLRQSWAPGESGHLGRLGAWTELGPCGQDRVGKLNRGRQGTWTGHVRSGRLGRLVNGSPIRGRANGSDDDVMSEQERG